MDFILGLDFGTHQSKLCLHYRPQNDDIFQFVEFEDEDGDPTLLFPSFVKVCADGRMLYGYDDESEAKEVSDEKMEFRYFKLASYSPEYNWKNKAIDPDIVSIWYLTYLLLFTDEYLRNSFGRDYVAFGSDVAVQMGVPYGINIKDSETIMRKGRLLLVSARKLFDKFTSLEEFLETKYDDLITKTSIVSKDLRKEASDYGFAIIPEAYAGLRSLTSRGKLSAGNMHILVDIGGGTTDIAFFTVRGANSEPDIHSMVSFHKGLNYVFDKYLEEHPGKSYYDLQRSFIYFPDNFKKAVSDYTKCLRGEISDMINKVVERSFMDTFKNHQLYNSYLEKAMGGRPIVYCGGGSMHKSLRIHNYYFDDVRHLDYYLLDIPNLQNEEVNESIFPILATSYGLSLYSDETIEMTDLTDLFNNLSQNKTSNTPSKSNNRFDHDD